MSSFTQMSATREGSKQKGELPLASPDCTAAGQGEGVSKRLAMLPRKDKRGPSQGREPGCKRCASVYQPWGGQRMRCACAQVQLLRARRAAAPTVHCFRMEQPTM
jgi:hypothetical protein